MDACVGGLRHCKAIARPSGIVASLQRFAIAEYASDT